MAAIFISIKGAMLFFCFGYCNYPGGENILSLSDVPTNFQMNSIF
nr:MAG TPA: hypothetical protein [Caudoviricetes sp.]